MVANITKFFNDDLADTDPALAKAIDQELGRQHDEIELIASENIVSKAVLQAQGSVMTNKYAEGYVGRRYYGGCEYVDIAETLAIERACQLFNCKFANVQPNSGSQANQGVFQALLQPGDTILGMSLADGGHLTHGSPANLSGKLFNIVQYGLNEKEEIDYDEMETRKIALEIKRKNIIIRKADSSDFVDKIGLIDTRKIMKDYQLEKTRILVDEILRKREEERFRKYKSR